MDGHSAWVGSPDSSCGRGVDTAMDTFKKFYPSLLEILPVDVLTIQLFSKNLLSDDHKDKLGSLAASKATNKEKATYFLDAVIAPGLRIGFTKQFDEMLVIMANSDNPPVKFLASEITKSRTPTEAHGEDTHSQGEYCVCVYFINN